MINGPRATTAHVRVKSGGMTTSGIIMRSNLETLRSATGVVDSCRKRGLSDHPSRSSGVDATSKAVEVVFKALGEAVKAAAAEHRENRRAIFILSRQQKVDLRRRKGE